MRVLWFTPKPISLLIDERIKLSVTGGWLDGISSEIINKQEIELGVCYPVNDTLKATSGIKNGVNYYGVKNIKDCATYSNNDEQAIKRVLEEFNPDVITVFGTEHTFQCSVIELCFKLGYIDRLVVWIQGMASIYYKHFDAGVPDSVINGHTLKETVRRDNLGALKKSFYIRGEQEKRALTKVKHVIGRTRWDQACTQLMCSQAEYHFCNETLRSPFYEGNWSLNNCKRHSIFISQSNYPIKGFHLVAESISMLMQGYPQIHLYATGRDVIHVTSKQKLRFSSYEAYKRKVIFQYGIQEHVTFTGMLSADEMKEQYLSANVFVCPSSIENSPNSLGEAMILGVP